jgi:hypothetical protein
MLFAWHTRNPEDGGSVFLCNISRLVPGYTFCYILEVSITLRASSLHHVFITLLDGVCNPMNIVGTFKFLSVFK